MGKNQIGLRWKQKPGRKRKSLADRFWAKVIKSDGCWLWSGAKKSETNEHYGRFWVDGKIQLAHRMAWKLVYGDIPEGLIICHKCDNPPCVNPDHLFAGTDADNVRDRHLKGRTVTPNQRKLI